MYQCNLAKNYRASFTFTSDLKRIVGLFLTETQFFKKIVMAKNNSDLLAKSWDWVCRWPIDPLSTLLEIKINPKTST